MKVIEQRERDFNELKLNGDGEFVRLEAKCYVVHIDTDEECESIQHHISVALEKDIEVYESAGNFRKLELLERNVVSSSQPVILFATNDVDKFDSLDLIIKTIMIANECRIEKE